MVWAEESLTAAPDWRAEVSVRLREYRKRQRRLRAGPAQPELGFDGEAGEAVLEPSVRTRTTVAPVARPVHRRPQRVERVEIDLLQPSLDFSGAQSPEASPGDNVWHPTLSLPVASLHERRLAGLLDAGVLLLAYGSFLALFGALGGQLAVSRMDAAVLVLTLALLYGQYFALFTLFGGATPGMMLRGLRVASFEGADPALRHLVWRSFGYLVSAGAMMLGFLWAFWDEEHLSWHDRISHTCVTWVEASRWSDDGGTSPVL